MGIPGSVHAPHISRLAGRLNVLRPSGWRTECHYHAVYAYDSLAGRLNRMSTRALHGRGRAADRLARAARSARLSALPYPCLRLQNGKADIGLSYYVVELQGRHWPQLLPRRTTMPTLASATTSTDASASAAPAAASSVGAKSDSDESALQALLLSPLLSPCALLFFHFPPLPPPAWKLAGRDATRLSPNCPPCKRRASFELIFIFCANEAASYWSDDWRGTPSSFVECRA